MCEVKVEAKLYTGQDVADAYQKGFREGVEAACKVHELPPPQWRTA